MFTGIIEDIGVLSRIERRRGGALVQVTVNMDLSSDQIGDSIAVNGVCLTIVAKSANSFQAEVSGETLARTTFAALKSGSRVNLERALTLASRLGGHLVTGHIDDVGEIVRREIKGDSVRFSIQVTAELSRYLIAKGSVAVNGISLTINACQNKEFDVNIIPHTQKRTTLEACKVGDKVNIEVDVLAKYVERLLKAPETLKKDGGLDLNFLAAHGFLAGKR